MRLDAQLPELRSEFLGALPLGLGTLALAVSKIVTVKWSAAMGPHRGKLGGVVTSIR